MHLALALLQNSVDPEQARKIALALMGILPILFLIFVAIITLPCWFICKKAGFSPWLSMLCLIPSFGLLILLYVLAFAEWKVGPVQATALPPYPYPPAPPRP